MAATSPDYAALSPEEATQESDWSLIRAGSDMLCSLMPKREPCAHKVLSEAHHEDLLRRHAALIVAPHLRKPKKKTKKAARRSVTSVQFTQRTPIGQPCRFCGPSRLLPASSGVLDVARKGNVGQLFQAVTARAATHNRDKNIDEALVVCEADYNGNTALHIAAEANNLMAARYLMSIGAPVDYQNADGLTPLHLAAKANALEVARELVSEGACTGVKAVRGKFMDKTALEVAASAGLIEMTETLLCASDDAVCPCDSDVMGVALAKLKKSNTRKGAAALLKSRQTASVVIQRWWRAASADQHKRRYRHAAKIQALVRGHQVRTWFRPILQRYRDARARRADFEVILRMCASDSNVGEVEHILLSKPWEVLDEEVEGGAEGKGTRSKIPTPPPLPSSLQPSYFPTPFYEKLNSVPIVVRAEPSSAARVAGVVHGGTETVLQGHAPEELRTDTESGVVWVRLANPNEMFGPGDAWTILSCTPRVTTTQNSVQSNSQTTLRVKPHVDYTCMSYGAWERSGLTIPNYARPDTFGADGCAHFYSVQTGSPEGPCIFCGVLPSAADDADASAKKEKAEPIYVPPDLNAFEEAMPPLPAVQTEELLLKSYDAGAFQMLKLLVESGVASVSTAPPGDRLSLLHTAAKDDALHVIDLVFAIEANEVRANLVAASVPATTTPEVRSDGSVSIAHAKAVLTEFFSARQKSDSLPRSKKRNKKPRNVPRVSFVGTQADPFANFSTGLLLTACTAGCESVTLRLLEILEDIRMNRLQRQSLHNAVVRHAVLNRLWRVLERFHAEGFPIGEAAETEGQDSPTASLVQIAPDDDGVLTYVLKGIDRLIGLGCHIDACNPAGVTAMMLAARRTSPVLAVELMKRGADDMQSSTSGWTAWTYAAKWGNVDVLKEMYNFKIESARAALESGDGETAAELAQHRFGVDHPLKSSTTLELAIQYGVSTGNYKALNFFLDRGCDLMCLNSKLSGIVDNLVEPRTRPQHTEAATTIQRWFRALRAPKASADDSGIAMPLDSSSIPVPPPLPPRLVSPPPPPSNPSANDLGHQVVAIRCTESVAVAAVLLRKSAEQAGAIVQKLVPKRKLLVSTGGQSKASNWKDTCAMLANVLGATRRHFDLESAEGRMFRKIPLVEQSVSTIHQLASSDAVCRMLWYECHEKNGSSTQLTKILPWNDVACAKVYMETIQGIEFHPWLVKFLAEKLHTDVLRERGVILLEALLDSAAGNASPSNAVDTQKMSDNCAAKQEATQPKSTGFLPEQNDLKTMTMLVKRVAGEEDALGSTEGDTSVLVGMIEARVNVESVVKQQFVKGNTAVRDTACAFIGRCFPDFARKCEVCFDGIDRPTLCCSQTGGEHFRKVPCEHEYCKPCLESWISSNVDQQLHQIKCPHEGCKFILYPDDVKRILGLQNPVYKKYIEYTTASYKERLHDFVTNAGSEWVKENTRLCPSCYVVIDRSSGCNSMLCTCGSRFNWNEGLRVTPKLIEEARVAAEARAGELTESQV